jgi:GDPmannose 4,6-dehydratase
MNKKVLILGISGQDGSLLAEHLLTKKNIKIFGLIRKSSNRNYNNLKKFINYKNFKIMHGDLLDIFSIENIIKEVKPDEIYNFADQDHVRWSYQIPSYSFDVTAFSVLKILEIIKNTDKNIKYFQPFTSNMFGNVSKSKLNEKEKFAPLSIYALSKASAFHICEFYKNIFNLKIYGGIFFNHESERRTPEYVTRKITKSVARIFYKKQKYLYLGDINTKIDWGYARDYVEAAYNLMQLKKPDYFVIGSGKAHSIKYFAEKAFNYVGLDYTKFIKIDKKLIRKNKNKTLVADTKKAKKLFNFKIKTNIDKLIKIMMENDLKIEKNND